MPLDDICAHYCATILGIPVMREWTKAARAEPEDVEDIAADCDGANDKVVVVQRLADPAPPNGAWKLPLRKVSTWG